MRGSGGARTMVWSGDALASDVLPAAMTCGFSWSLLAERLGLEELPAKQWARVSGGLLQEEWRAATGGARRGQPAQNEDEQHEQEGVVGSSHGLQSASDVEVYCSASALAVRQARPHFLRTALSLAYLQTTHRSLCATLRLLQLSALGGMWRKTVVKRARTMTNIQPVRAPVRRSESHTLAVRRRRLLAKVPRGGARRNVAGTK